MNGLVIRECAGDDIAKVMELDRSWEAEDSTYGYYAEGAEGLARRLGPYFLVADTQGMVVGFAYGSVHTSEGLAVIPADETYFELDALYVGAEHRSNGIGGMMLEELLREARRNGIERFMLYSASKSLDSILRFYRRHGSKDWFVRMYI